MKQIVFASTSCRFLILAVYKILLVRSRKLEKKLLWFQRTCSIIVILSHNHGHWSQGCHNRSLSDQSIPLFSVLLNAHRCKNTASCPFFNVVNPVFFSTIIFPILPQRVYKSFKNKCNVLVIQPTCLYSCSNCVSFSNTTWILYFFTNIFRLKKHEQMYSLGDISNTAPRYHPVVDSKINSVK